MSSSEPKPQKSRDELLALADELLQIQADSQKMLKVAEADLFKDLDANQQQAVRVFSQGITMIRPRS